MTVKEVPQPKEERSYLQQGYIDHLKGHARLLDDDGAELPLPDSNMMIVIEKTSDSPSRRGHPFYQAVWLILRGK